MSQQPPISPKIRNRIRSRIRCHSRRSAIVAAVTLVLLAGPARAQQTSGENAPGENASGENASTGPAIKARLEKRLAALKTERAEVEATNETARSAAQKTEAAMAGRRDELARRIVAARIEERRLRVEATKLEARARDAAKSTKALKLARRRVVDATRGFIEQLRVLLAEMPAEEARRDRLTELDKDLAGGDVERMTAAFAEVLTIHAQLARAGRSVTIRELELWTAKERKERVQLLAAGFVAFAYRTADGRLGLAVGAPTDARGFRWTEDLPQAERTALAAAFGGGETRPVPIDALGRVRVEALEREEDLRTRLEAGGFVMIPLAGVALLALLVALERAVMLFLAGFGRSVGDAVLAAVDADRLDDARQLCSRSGLVPGVLSAALAHADHGPKVMEDAVQERLLHDHPGLQKRLGGLAVLGAIAPLLGLLGTVTGIIQTFAVIKTYGSADPGLMAGGISEALITTATGLVVAIPILLAHSLLSGRVDALLADAERQVASLLNRLGLRHRRRSSTAAPTPRAQAAGASEPTPPRATETTRGRAATVSSDGPDESAADPTSNEAVTATATGEEPSSDDDGEGADSDRFRPEPAGSGAG